MMDEQKMRAIPPEKFRFIRSEERIHDEKLKTKPIAISRTLGSAFARIKAPW